MFELLIAQFRLQACFLSCFQPLAVRRLLMTLMIVRMFVKSQVFLVVSVILNHMCGRSICGCYYDLLFERHSETTHTRTVRERERKREEKKKEIVERKEKKVCVVISRRVPTEKNEQDELLFYHIG